ncbi:MAG: hypothetical protein KC733_07030, partial [Candidatus Omnitrophica bacterium]|nr:hypothetical protein [Candidatus Omnitrophota bacterium]
MDSLEAEEMLTKSALRDLTLANLNAAVLTLGQEVLQPFGQEDFGKELNVSLKSYMRIIPGEIDHQATSISSTPYQNQMNNPMGRKLFIATRAHEFGHRAFYNGAPKSEADLAVSELASDVTGFVIMEALGTKTDKSFIQTFLNYLDDNEKTYQAKALKPVAVEVDDPHPAGRIYLSRIAEVTNDPIDFKVLLASIREVEQWITYEDENMGRMLASLGESNPYPLANHTVPSKAALEQALTNGTTTGNIFERITKQYGINRDRRATEIDRLLVLNNTTYAEEQEASRQLTTRFMPQTFVSKNLTANTNFGDLSAEMNLTKNSLLAAGYKNEKEMLQQTMAAQRLVKEQSSAVIYEIPNVSQYVLYAPKGSNDKGAVEKDIKLEPIEDADANTWIEFDVPGIGQPVAKMGSHILMKKYRGVPTGISNRQKDVSWSPQKDRQYEEYLAQVANMDPEAFNQLATTLVTLSKKGYSFDLSEAGSLLMDSETNRFHVINVQKASKQENIPSFEQMVIPLLDNTYANNYKGSQEKKLESYRADIMDKVLHASIFAGMEVPAADNEVLVETVRLIGYEGKWPSIRSQILEQIETRKKNIERMIAWENSKNSDEDVVVNSNRQAASSPIQMQVNNLSNPTRTYKQVMTEIIKKYKNDQQSVIRELAEMVGLNTEKIPQGLKLYKAKSNAPTDILYELEFNGDVDVDIRTSLKSGVQTMVQQLAKTGRLEFPEDNKILALSEYKSTGVERPSHELFHLLFVSDPQAQKEFSQQLYVKARDLNLNISYKSLNHFLENYDGVNLGKYIMDYPTQAVNYIIDASDIFADALADRLQIASPFNRPNKYKIFDEYFREKDFIVNENDSQNKIVQTMTAPLSVRERMEIARQQTGKISTQTGENSSSFQNTAVALGTMLSLAAPYDGLSAEINVPNSFQNPTTVQQGISRPLQNRQYWDVQKRKPSPQSLTERLNQEVSKALFQDSPAYMRAGEANTKKINLIQTTIRDAQARGDVPKLSDLISLSNKLVESDFTGKDSRVKTIKEEIKKLQGIYTLKEYNPQQPTIFFIPGSNTGVFEKYQPSFEQLSDKYNVVYLYYNHLDSIENISKNLRDQWSLFKDNHNVQNFGVVTHSYAGTILNKAILDNPDIFKGAVLAQLAPTIPGSWQARSMPEQGSVGETVFSAVTPYGEISTAQNPFDYLQKTLSENMGAIQNVLPIKMTVLVDGDEHVPPRDDQTPLAQQYRHDMSKALGISSDQLASLTYGGEPVTINNNVILPLAKSSHSDLPLDPRVIDSLKNFFGNNLEKKASPQFRFESNPINFIAAGEDGVSQFGDDQKDLQFAFNQRFNRVETQAKQANSIQQRFVNHDGSVSIPLKKQTILETNRYDIPNNLTREKAKYFEDVVSKKLNESVSNQTFKDVAENFYISKFLREYDNGTDLGMLNEDYVSNFAKIIKNLPKGDNLINDHWHSSENSAPWNHVLSELYSVYASVYHNQGPLYSQQEVPYIAETILKELANKDILKNLTVKESRGYDFMKRLRKEINVENPVAFVRLEDGKLVPFTEIQTLLKENNLKVIEFASKENLDKSGSMQYRVREVSYLNEKNKDLPSLVDAQGGYLKQNWPEAPSPWTANLRQVLAETAFWLKTENPNFVFVSEGGLYKGTMTEGTDIDTTLYIQGNEDPVLREKIENVFNQKMNERNLKFKRNSSFIRFVDKNIPEITFAIREKEKGLLVTTPEGQQLIEKNIGLKRQNVKISLNRREPFKDISTSVDDGRNLAQQRFVTHDGAVFVPSKPMSSEKFLKESEIVERLTADVADFSGMLGFTDRELSSVFLREGLSLEERTAVFRHENRHRGSFDFEKEVNVDGLWPVFNNLFQQELRKRGVWDLLATRVVNLWGFEFILAEKVDKLDFNQRYSLRQTLQLQGFDAMLKQAVQLTGMSAQEMRESQHRVLEEIQADRDIDFRTDVNIPDFNRPTIDFSKEISLAYYTAYEILDKNYFNTPAVIEQNPINFIAAGEDGVSQFGDDQKDLQFAFN